MIGDSDDCVSLDWPADGAAPRAGPALPRDCIVLDRPADGAAPRAVQRFSAIEPRLIGPRLRPLGATVQCSRALAFQHSSVQRWGSIAARGVNARSGRARVRRNGVMCGARVGIGCRTGLPVGSLRAGSGTARSARGSVGRWAGGRIGSALVRGRPGRRREHLRWTRLGGRGVAVPRAGRDLLDRRNRSCLEALPSRRRVPACGVSCAPP